MPTDAIEVVDENNTTAVNTVDEPKEADKTETTEVTETVAQQAVAQSETATAEEKPSTEEKAIYYRGYPLRRQGDILYYGDFSDKYIALLQVTKSETENGLEVSKTVLIKLFNNDPDIESRKRVEKKAEKDGLYPAIDLAATWLDRYTK